MPNKRPSPLITILGPTASGKTKLAVNIAQSIPVEIISADSRQVYKYMDLGTGKDLEEYGDTPFHLINILEPDAEYNLFEFSHDFIDAFERITSQDKIPLLVGGTGMYLDAVLSRYKLTIANIDKKTREHLEKKTEVELVHILKDLKPLQHNCTDLHDKQRLIRAIEIAQAEKLNNSFIDWPSFKPLILGIKTTREELKQRIKNRLKDRFDAGMINETEALIKRGISHERIDSFGLEYRYILKHINGELNYNDMFQKLNSAIYKFSKQQEKWFRNIEKKGHNIIWLNTDDDLNSSALNSILRFLKENSIDSAAY